MSADKTNYGGWRAHSIVEYIVIHYTNGDKDTAENEGKYFQRKNIHASAHFFIDRDGNVIKSVPLDHVAWSVGGKKWNDCKKTGGGKYYKKCMNNNSVSIELCGISKRDASPEQIEACRNVIIYIRKYCKNAKTIIRHFDVTGKHCPSRYMDDEKWDKLRKAIG